MRFGRYAVIPHPYYDADTGAGGGTGGEGSEAGGTDGQGAGGDGSGAGTGTGETVTKDQASAAVQARIKQLQDKHEAETAPLRKLAEKISKRTGMTAEQVLARFEAEESANTNLQQASQAGLNPQLLQYLQGLQGNSQQTAAEVKKLQRELERNQLKANSSYADYDTVKDSVESYADKHGVSLEQAYWAVNGPTRSTQLAREAEQRVIAEREEMARLGVVSSDLGGSGKDGSKFTDAEEAYVAKMFGADPEEWAALKGPGKNLDDFEAHLARKNKKK